MVKTTEATIAWSNRDLPFIGGEEALLEECAWHIPARDPHASGCAPTRIFYAECYGGDGIHHNGGGVRCAWTGDWLVKGVGINLLSGYSDEDAREHRKNGRASLCEVLVEAVWGEVLRYALPFGATRMTAVIKTGETLAETRRSVAGTGIREFAWRPANFMRAHRFHVLAENRALIPSDTARVKAAIARLPDMLPMPSALPATHRDQLEPLQRLTIGLDEMVRRFAEQMATSKAKRLSHGTLTPSNICLDGRWNDLNSVTSLPCYGYRKNMTPFWEDHLSLNKTIEQLCFYIGKYFPAGCGRNIDLMPTSLWLTNRYRQYYGDALARRFVLLCGYPQIIADRVWATAHGQKAMRELSILLTHLARSGHSIRRPYDDDMRKNTVSGDYDLLEILWLLARPASSHEKNNNLDQLIAASSLRQNFHSAYYAVERLMFSEARNHRIENESFRRLTAINCHKAGRKIPHLYRHVLFERFECLAEEYRETHLLRQAAEDMIAAIVNEARMVYQEQKDFTTILWCDHTGSVEYNARTNRVIIDIAGSKSEFSCHALLDSTATGPEISNLFHAARGYWGSVLQEVMQ